MKTRSRFLVLLGLICFSNLLVFAQKETKPVIAVHIIDFTSDDALEKLALDIPAYAAKGVNLLILEVDYNFEFQSHPELRQTDRAITLGGARKFADACKKSGIRIVPEFQSLGHQSWDKYTFALLTKYPELDLTPGAFPNNEGIYCRAWDPMNPKVNEIVFPLIDEILDAFQADALHMGMDEVFLIGSDKSPSTFGKNPAEVYAKVVNDFYGHFSKKKVQLYMWGDRLIDGAKYPYGEWESSMNGTAAAIDMIPKDIVICDWHYELRDTYPSVPMFIEKGFKVLPCSYKDPEAAKGLIKYSLRQQHPAMLGHMFTSWGAVPKDSLLVYPAFVQGLEVFKNKLIWNVFIEEKSVNKDGSIDAALLSDKKDLKIYYTTDRKTPDKNSLKYTSPVRLTKSATLKAIAYSSDKPAGEVVSKSFILHQAIGKKVTLKRKYSPNYPPKDSLAVLVNGVAGTESFADGEWIGFNGSDIEVTIDLGGIKELSEIAFNTYNDPVSWIYPAERAEIWLSNDGLNYSKKIEKEFVDIKNGKIIQNNFDLTKTKAAFIKVFIHSRLIPETANQGAGQPAWIFIDEVIVK